MDKIKEQREANAGKQRETSEFPKDKVDGGRAGRDWRKKEGYIG